MAAVHHTMRWAIWTKAGATADNARMDVDGTPRPEGASTDFPRPPVGVRDMRSGDAAAVRSLVLAGLAEHWGSVDPSLNPDLDDLAAAHPGSRTVVAVVAVVAVDGTGTIVGTGTVVPRGPGTMVGTGTIVPSGMATAEVVRMSVAASQRGTGVGRQVLDALTEVARSWGVQRLVLETTADWTDTVAFYERCGFRITHHTDGEFGRDAWFERRL